MSRRRPDVQQPFRGQRDPATGRPLCCWCGKTVPPRSIRWCGDECVQTYLIAKGDQNAARRWLLGTQAGVCQRCGLDTLAEQRAMLARHGSLDRFETRMMRDRCRWEADHIVPIAEGGALARENLRTLCRPCHVIVTREFRARIATSMRREARSL